MWSAIIFLCGRGSGSWSASTKKSSAPIRKTVVHQEQHTPTRLMLVPCRVVLEHKYLLNFADSHN